MNAISDSPNATRKRHAKIQLEAMNVFVVRVITAMEKRIATILTSVFSIHATKMLIVSIFKVPFIVNVLITLLVMGLRVKITTNVLTATMTVIQMRIVKIKILVIHALAVMGIKAMVL